MNSNLLQFIMMLIEYNNTWITKDTYKCVNSVTNKYFDSNQIVIMSDQQTVQLNFTNNLVSLQPPQIPHKSEPINVVLIYKQFKNWAGKDVHGRVLIITESLNDITSLWKRFKLLNLMVILQNGTSSHIYTWYPYNSKYCNNIELVLINKWSNGKYVDKKRIRAYTAPKKASGCTLKVSAAICPPFVMYTMQGVNYGIEPDILKDLARQLDMKLSLVIPRDYDGYFSAKFENGIFYGMYTYLDERSVDIAGGCFSIDRTKIHFEILPSFIRDKITWFLPGPIPSEVAFGFITAFNSELWMAVGVSFISVLIFAILTISDNSISSAFIWTLGRFLAMANRPLRNTINLKLFGYVLELAILIIATLYRSFLLVQLFLTPMEVYLSGEEGVNANLSIQVRPRDFDAIDHNDPVWIKILSSTLLNKSIAFDYKPLLNRSGMVLGSTIVDTYIFHYFFPNISIRKMISFDEKPFYHLNMAFMMPAHHPLAKILSLKLLYIIEAGLPMVYLEKTYRSLPNNVRETSEPTKPVDLKIVITIFILGFFLLCISLIVFIVEIMFFAIKKCCTPSGFVRKKRRLFAWN